MHRHGLCVDERVQVDSSGVILSRERKFESRQHHLRGIDAPCQRHWHAHTRVPTAHLRIQKRSIIPARAHTYVYTHTPTPPRDDCCHWLLLSSFSLLFSIFFYTSPMFHRARGLAYIFLSIAQPRNRSVCARGRPEITVINLEIEKRTRVVGR